MRDTPHSLPTDSLPSSEGTVPSPSSSSPQTSPSGSPYIRSGEIRQFLAPISVMTVHKMIRAKTWGPYRRTNGPNSGIYMVNRSLFLEWLEQKEKEQEGGNEKEQQGGNGQPLRICLYARVSTPKQKGDKERQIERLREWAERTYPQSHITLRHDTASGLSFERSGLVKMTREILEGKYDIVAVTFPERLARFARSLFQSVLLPFGGARLEVVEGEKDPSEKDELVQELLDVLHVASCRQYSLRASKRYFQMPPDTVIKRAYQLRREGFQVKSCYLILLQEGATQSNTKGTRPLTYAKLRRCFVRNTKEWKICQKILSGDGEEGEGNKGEVLGGDDGKPKQIDSQSSTFGDFCHQFLRKKKGEKLSLSLIYSFYVQWCHQNNLQAESRVLCGKVLRRVIPRDCIKRSDGTKVLNHVCLYVPPPPHN